MAEPAIPVEVSRFLEANIQSVEQLEILLLLKAGHDQEWLPREVYQRILTNVHSVEESMDRLCGKGLLRKSEASKYQFISTPESDRILDRLAVLYKEMPARILYALYGPARPDIQAFSQAFDLRKPK